VSYNTVVGKKLGLVVRAHVQEVMGWNPAIYWMEVSVASYYMFNEKMKLR
jgi:hypothetical protein